MRNLEDRTYRITPLHPEHPWWAAARASIPTSDEWSAFFPLFQDQPIAVRYADAENFRKWAITLPEWPSRREDCPLRIENLGNVDHQGEERIRWPLTLQASPTERAEIEAAASAAGLSVATFVRDVVLTAILVS